MTDAVSQLIDEKGGPAAVAADIGRSGGSIRVWKHRRSIPRDAWPDLIQKYPDVSLERLIEIEKSKIPTPSTPEVAA